MTESAWRSIGNARPRRQARRLMTGARYSTAIVLQKKPEERGVFPFSIEATIGARIRSRVCGDGKRIKADIQSSTLWKQWGACGVKCV